MIFIIFVNELRMKLNEINFREYFNLTYFIKLKKDNTLNYREEKSENRIQRFLRAKRRKRSNLGSFVD